MTTITTSLPPQPKIESLSAWQTTLSTGETLPITHKEQTLSGWQATLSSGETFPTTHVEQPNGMVAAPIIGVKHRSSDTMPNYTVPPLPYKGSAS